VDSGVATFSTRRTDLSGPGPPVGHRKNTGSQRKFAAMSASAAATFVNNLLPDEAQSEIAKRRANRDNPPQLACAGLADATT
jgi:hypothetical protein